MYQVNNNIKTLINSIWYKRFKLYFTDCGNFTAIVNGHLANYSETLLSIDGLLVGYPQTLRYACNEGYATNPGTETVLNCNGLTGAFEPALPECFRS